MQGVEAQRLEARERKEKWEAEELRGFALARANQTGAFGFVCAAVNAYGTFFRACLERSHMHSCGTCLWSWLMKRVSINKGGA